MLYFGIVFLFYVRMLRLPPVVTSPQPLYNQLTEGLSPWTIDKKIIDEGSSSHLQANKIIDTREIVHQE